MSTTLESPPQASLAIDDRLRLVIVDDDTTARLILRTVLRAAPMVYIADEARDGGFIGKDADDERGPASVGRKRSYPCRCSGPDPKQP